MAIADTEEKILDDLIPIVRRAIALGRRLEKDAVHARIVSAIEGEEPAALVATNLIRPADKIVEQSVLEERRSYPYGHVKRTVAATLLANRGGIERSAIRAYCIKHFDSPFEDSAIQTALKTLAKDEYARYFAKRNKWIPTQALIDENSNENTLGDETEGAD